MQKSGEFRCLPCFRNSKLLPVPLHVLTESEALGWPTVCCGNISRLNEVGACWLKLAFCDNNSEERDCCSDCCCCVEVICNEFCSDTSKDCDSIEFSWTMCVTDISSFPSRKDEAVWPKLVSPSESSISIRLWLAFPLDESVEKCQFWLRWKITNWMDFRFGNHI